ncbi:MAG: FecR domain-containing protein [Bacteroidales bacterium]|jgi:ferric-dicitrate binding protein FerR (iron transport regulator)|nr:FecR domain-containing protein [Bacteroidales bacterium]
MEQKEHNDVLSPDELLLRCLEGTADRETYEHIRQWAAASPQNRRRYREVLDVLIASGLLKPVDRKMQERIWKRLSAKIWGIVKSGKYVRLTLGKWVAAAAVLLLAYVAGAKNANPSDHHLQYTFESAENGTSMLMLSDGSKVWLNKATTLRYGDDYGHKKREIALTGEAYFEVARDAGKPFIVKTAQVDVEAVGTQFNVRAYPDEPTVSATLTEGSVKVFAGAKEILVEQVGQQVRYDKTGNTIMLKNTNGEQYTAWKDGLMIFDREPIESVFEQMERNFNMVIRLKNRKLADKKITGRFSLNEKPEKILKVLQHSLTFNFYTKNDTVFVK